MNSLPKPTPKAAAQNAQVIKARLRKAIVTKKKVDLDSVNGRGKEVLSFIKNNAKKDLENIEAALFEKVDFDALATKLEDIFSTSSDVDASE